MVMLGANLDSNGLDSDGILVLRRPPVRERQIIDDVSGKRPGMTFKKTTQQIAGEKTTITVCFAPQHPPLPTVMDFHPNALTA